MKERIITGIILALAVGLAAIFTSWLVFAGLLILVMAIAATEWTTFICFKNTTQKCAYLMSFGFCLLVALGILINFPDLALLILGIATIFWLLVPFLLFKSQLLLKYINSTLILSILSIIISIGFFIAAVMLKRADVKWFFILVILVASADSFAYFFGRKIGKHKLAPMISPGKSIEGVVAGFIMTAMIALIMCLVYQFSLHQSIGFCIMAMCIALISVAGDLFESLIKRQRNLKDSGKILPGHGGILDRIDGLSAVAPLFVLSLLLLGLLK